MSELEKLKPKTKHRVMDLVAQAGHDVSDWAASMSDPAKASVNPKYCYEWSFLQPGCAAVFNIWYDQLQFSGGAITLTDNLRAQMTKYAKLPKRTIWRTRARRFDEALQQVRANGLQVRAIINAGKRRRIEDENAKSSVVDKRELDSVPWALTGYDAEDGTFTLTRGTIVAPPVDHIAMGATAYEVVPTKQHQGIAFIRAAAVRIAAYERAKGLCEYCGVPGFLMKNGARFLETHHIQYLSEDGPDHLDNVAALCANHHREAHYGAEALLIRAHLVRLRQGNGAQH